MEGLSRRQTRVTDIVTDRKDDIGILFFPNIFGISCLKSHISHYNNFVMFQPCAKMLYFMYLISVTFLAFKAIIKIVLFFKAKKKKLCRI